MLQAVVIKQQLWWVVAAGILRITDSNPWPEPPFSLAVIASDTLQFPDGFRHSLQIISKVAFEFTAEAYPLLFLGVILLGFIWWWCLHWSLSAFKQGQLSKSKATQKGGLFDGGFVNGCTSVLSDKYGDKTKKSHIIVVSQWGPTR